MLNEDDKRKREFDVQGTARQAMKRSHKGDEP
jgi:hypothetical protein